MARQMDELGVHLFFAGEIGFVNADFDVGIVLNAVEHFESAPTACAFNGIG